MPSESHNEFDPSGDKKIVREDRMDLGVEYQSFEVNANKRKLCIFNRNMYT